MKKNSGIKIGVFLAIVLVIFASQAVLAEEPVCEPEPIIGTIPDINYEENEITIDYDTVISGIPLNYLEKWDVAILEIDSVVFLQVHECINDNIMACEISFDNGETWLDLRPRLGKPEAAETSGGARQGRSL